VEFISVTEKVKIYKKYKDGEINLKLDHQQI